MSELIVNSSGNVFIDLGYSSDEAAILQMRADLMADLRKFIKAKRLTQGKAAAILGVSQSRVSDLTRGKWEKFSLEMLITLATRAGMQITLMLNGSLPGPPPCEGR
jgi:predicted XRE-type DNA-binding protein